MTSRKEILFLVVVSAAIVVLVTTALLGKKTSKDSSHQKTPRAHEESSRHEATLDQKKDKARKTSSRKDAAPATTRTISMYEVITFHEPKTIAPPDRVSARRHVVAALGQALDQNRYEEAALFNSILSQEAFQRAYRTMKAWTQIRDPETGFIPRNHREIFWNAKDTAADCFPFMLLASHFLDKESEKLWLDTLAREREITGTLPRTIRMQPVSVIQETSRTLIFGGAEYVKDGLLAVTERLGRGPWFDRMEEITHAILTSSTIQAPAGLIPAVDSEVNGDLLQALPRLYWATGREEYLTMAERIAETFLFEIIPKNDGLPAAFWDFAEGKSITSRFKFRDHGNEIIPGLSEIYFLEKAKGRPQAARYREPLKKFLDLILTVGRTGDGLWYNTVNTQTREVIDKSVIDNWGYVLNGFKTFDLAEGTNIYAAEIQRGMRGAASRKSFPWQGVDQDGYADTIESMLYLLPWFDIPECRAWVDDEIEVLFLKQLPSGFVEGWYLDGNFIRTALLYAQYKTQGAMAAPWREDVRMGAALDKRGNALFIYITADSPWTGAVQFDYPRHRVIWNMSADYPRLNSTPEWFVVEPKETYGVLNLDSGKKKLCSGESLIRGFAVTLDGRRPVRLKVAEVKRAASQ